MVRPVLRSAVFLLLALTSVWIWTVTRRGDPSPDPEPATPLREAVATRLDDGRIRFTARALGLMGTEVTLTLFGDEETALRKAAGAAFARMEDLEARYSRWRAESDVSRVNAGAGEPVGVHAGTFALVERAIEIGRRTGGAFDVTVGPLIRFWRERETWPSDAEIAAVRAHVGPDRVTLRPGEPPTIAVAAGSSLDLGGIAKGTIVDAAGEVLAGAGVASFLINAGGDLLARGGGPDGEGIPVALRDPTGPHGATLSGGRLRLRDAALCTSGSYERYHEIGGRRASHIVDPRTGRPVEGVVIQASVLAPTCETADALATALMVLDPEDGLAVAKAMEGVEALLVTDASGRPEIRETPGFATLRAEGSR